MSGPSITNRPVSPVGQRSTGTGPWRMLLAIERRERAVAMAQSSVGRLALVGLFTALSVLAGISLPYAIAAAAFAYLPGYRNWIALAAAVVALARSSGLSVRALHPILLQERLPQSAGRGLVLAALALYLCAAWATLLLIRRHPTLVLARRPVVCGLGMIALLCVLATSPLVQGWPRAGAWAFLAVSTSFLWVFAYAVQDQRSRAAGPLSFQMGIFAPFWRSSVGSLSPTPFGKGAAFLRKHQARSGEELAVTQLKALKLLAWALVLTAAHTVLTNLVEVRAGVPKPASAYAAFLQGQPFPALVNWSSLVWGTLSEALGLAIWGHKIIAVARLAGFRLPRNTWRPLESRTLAEFWNRYYYYFKELLVDFFFFPTFLRVFRSRPRLRVFFATFMAAGVGNALYHFIRDLHFVASMGWRDAAAGYASYVFYCAALATGIGISQARTTAGRKLPTSRAGRLWCILCVWTFFVCLQVFAEATRTFPFLDRVAFFVSLFGIAR